MASLICLFHDRSGTGSALLISHIASGRPVSVVSRQNDGLYLYLAALRVVTNSCIEGVSRRTRYPSIPFSCCIQHASACELRIAFLESVKSVKQFVVGRYVCVDSVLSSSVCFGVERRSRRQQTIVNQALKTRRELPLVAFTRSLSQRWIVCPGAIVV